MTVDSNSYPALFELLQGYSALKPPRLLSFPHHLRFALVHDFILYSVLLNPHLSQYPPSRAYQMSFWKWAIIQLEILLGSEAGALLFLFSADQSTAARQDAEIDQRLYDHQISLITASGPTFHDVLSPPPPPSFVTHYWQPVSRSSAPMDALDATTPAEFHSVTLFESRTTIESGTTGLRTWRASFVLAQFLIQNPTLLLNKSVLELGSGTGFLGLVVADIQASDQGYELSGRASLQLTDANEDVLRRCYKNTQLPCNASYQHRDLSVRALDWSDALEADRVNGLRTFLGDAGPDLILGADILYHPDMIGPFLATLSLSLQASTPQRTAEAYLALTVRNADLLDLFLSTLEEHSLLAEELSLGPEIGTQFLELSEGSDQAVKIFKIVLRND
ncbi:hypothetical protein BC834DRAFT_23420 [Gloeopeniophorella convolvens]|nr:hypothetical protein BC834DRAFT_23420 [Gloeopeniophorella convolvens]